MACGPSESHTVQNNHIVGETYEVESHAAEMLILWLLRKIKMIEYLSLSFTHWLTMRSCKPLLKIFKYPVIWLNSNKQIKICYILYFVYILYNYYLTFSPLLYVIISHKKQFFSQMFFMMCSLAMKHFGLHQSFLYMQCKWNWVYL